MNARSRWWIIGSAWALVIAWVTLRSIPEQALRVSELPWYCIFCGDGGTADVLLNVLLFIPLGIAARALGVSLGRTVLVVLPLTIGIETAQALLLVGRDASLGDVLTNTVGGCVGWAGYPCLVALSRPSRQQALGAASLLLMLCTATWFATGVGLRPALSEAAPWVGQRLHRWPYHDPFRGTLQDAQIDGIPVPEDPMDVVTGWRDSLDLIVDVRRSTTDIPLRPVSILRIVDARERPQLSLTQQRNDLVIEIPLRASDWGWHTPQWRFHDAFAIRAGRAWRFRWRWRGHRIELTSGPVDVAHTATSVASVRSLSVAVGWVFVHPFVTMVGPSEPLWTSLWLAWWFGLLGWLAGWCDVRARWLIGIAAVGGFAAAGAITEFPPSPLQLATAAASYLVLLAAAVRRQTILR